MVVKSFSKTLFAVLILASSCVSQDTFDEVKSDNLRLREELEDLKYGADKLLKQANEYYKSKDFDKSLEKIELLLNKHNETAEAGKARQLKSLIEKTQYDLTEASDWASVLVRDDDTAYIDIYFSKYPQGKHISEARDMRRKATVRFEAIAFEQALQENSSRTWNTFLENYPDRSDRDEIYERIVRAEVDEISNRNGVSALPSAYRTSNESSDNSYVSITNNTGYLLTIRYSGPDVKSVSIPASESMTVYLSSGTYKVAATAGSASCAGVEILNGRYSSTYKITTTTSYGRY